MGEVQLPVGSAYRRCIESEVGNERSYYSRFITPPPGVGQANTLGIAMRRASLGESEGACVTFAGSPGRINHEYSTIAGVRESVHDILMNLKEIVLATNLSAAQEAHIPIIGPRKVVARDIVLPPSVKVTRPAQHVATITRKIHLSTESRIERGYGYRGRSMMEFQKGSFPLDAVSMPVQNANYSIHRLESHGGGIMKEMLLLEVRTNGSLAPREAIYEASRNSANLSSPSPRNSLDESIYGKG
nr:RNA polymerase alpha subunit [Selaginella stauntoniana]